MSDAVLQKLLPPAVTRLIADEGHALVRGAVVRAVDATALTTPAALWAAHGWQAEGEIEYADVLRFVAPPLTSLEAPAAYPTGFLQGDAVVPVWWLEPTRVPTGAELWRVSADGEQRLASAYAGPALGWRGARGYTPPVELVGPRAVFEGREYPAGFMPDPSRIELVALGDAPLADAEEVRPGVRRRIVAVSACERVFELRLTCVWRGVPWRILQSAGDRVLLSLLGDRTPDDLSGMAVLEPGAYEAVAPLAEITEQMGTTLEHTPVA